MGDITVSPAGYNPHLNSRRVRGDLSERYLWILNPSYRPVIQMVLRRRDAFLVPVMYGASLRPGGVTAARPAILLRKPRTLRWHTGS